MGRSSGMGGMGAPWLEVRLWLARKGSFDGAVGALRMPAYRDEEAVELVSGGETGIARVRASADASQAADKDGGCGRSSDNGSAPKRALRCERSERSGSEGGGSTAGPPASPSAPGDPNISVSRPRCSRGPHLWRRFKQRPHAAHHHALPAMPLLPTPAAPALSSAWTFGSTGVLVDADEWRRLRVRHTLSFLPAALLLVLLAVASRRAPCLLPVRPVPPYNYDGDTVVPSFLPPKVDAQCDAALHPSLTAAVTLLGAVFWLASWSLRTASWRLATWAGLAVRALLRWRARDQTVAGVADDEQPLLDAESEVPQPLRGTEVLAVLLQTVSIELLRLAALATANALLLAELAVRVGLGNRSEHSWDPIRPGHGWMGVGPQDPRFSMALWTALGWAAAQTVVGSCQILGQLELYRPPGAEVLFRPPLTRTATINSQARRGGWEPEAAPAPELSSAEQLAQARDALQAQNDLHAVETGECDLSDEVDDEEEFEEQLRLHEQRALEATLGAPLPDVPVSLSLLWRIDGVLFSLGTTVRHIATILSTMADRIILCLACHGCRACWGARVATAFT